MMKKIAFAISAAAMAICANAQTDPWDLTEALLNTPDRHTLIYRLPSWQDTAEDGLRRTPTDSLNIRTHNALQKIECGKDVNVWAQIWKRGANAWLIWMATEPDADGTRAMAFADELPALKDTATLPTIVPTADNGLMGLQVMTSGKTPLLYAVPDVRLRMALRVITDYTYTKDQKAEAEALLMKRMPQDLLGADLAGLPELMVADDPDGELRMVTYLCPSKDFTSHCGGWAVQKTRKGKVLKVNKLTDNTAKIGNPEQATLTPKSWYGMLVTDIVPFSVGGKDYYLMQGFKSADALVKRRVVDVLNITNGSLTFGAKVFLHPRETYKRRVFAYSARASMSIFYEAKSKMLVMDHLEPSDPLLTGQPAYYGPDLSYDAYMLTKEGWKFQNDIQITAEKGAQPNREVSQTASDQITQPGGSKRQNTGSSSSWGRGSQRQPVGGSKGATWFDKGKGNSAPNIRKR